MTDEIKELISLMEELAGRQKYEDAQHVLNSIKNELAKKEVVNGKELLDRILKGERKKPTIKRTYDIVTGNSIRLNEKSYNFSDFLGMLSSVTERLEAIKSEDDYTVRKIVAEEMVCRKMVVPQTYKGKKPNRAFLDVAYKVNPDLCKAEIGRREKVKLWKAIESGKKEDIEKAKSEVSKYRD